jgi:hypothetical protein
VYKLSLLMVSLLVSSGCARAIERSEVTRRFNSLFACSNPHVVSASGGYRAEGCGVTAHFRCFDTPEPRDHHRAHEGDGLGHAIADVAQLSLDSDTCILEHSERREMPKHAAAVEKKRSSEGVRLKTRALVHGGHLEAVGMPKKDAEHAILAVHSIRDLGAAPCQASLFRDGTALSLVQVARVSDHEARLALRVSDLKDLHRAQRLSGSVCGFEFELDAEGQKAASLFEVRFREELARSGAATSSGGETPAQSAEQATAPAQSAEQASAPAQP